MTNQAQTDPNLCAIVVLPGPASSFDIRFGIFNVAADHLDFLIMDSFRALGGESLLHQSVFGTIAPPSGTLTVHYPSGVPGKGPVVLGFTGFTQFESAAFNTDPDTYDNPDFGATVLDLDQTVIELVYASDVSGGLRCQGTLKFDPTLNASIANIVQVSTVSIDPVVDGSIRDGLDFPKDGTPDTVLENSVVQVLNVERAVQPFEDRGIIEFDISNLRPLSTQMDLVLNVFSSKGPFPFRVDVFTYEGHGFLSLADFNAGTFFKSFEYSGESVIKVDVAPVIANLRSSGKAFAGFNFRTVPSTIPSNGPFVAFGSLEFPPAAQLRPDDAAAAPPATASARGP